LWVKSFLVPEYPALAGTARVYGDVALDIILNPDGSVASSKVISGHPLLRQVAQENSMTWKFAAADKQELRNKEFTLTYKFRLREPVGCDGGPTRVTIESYDLVSVSASPPIICDPGIEIKKKHWYWPW
jgi:TonB family protein